MMEMDGLDNAKCQKSRKRDMMGIIKIVKLKKTKPKRAGEGEMQWLGIFDFFRERAPSL